MHYAAPALLIGLGARILLDTFTRTEEPTLHDFILIGAWQGVVLQYAYKSTEYALLVALGILAKLFFDFSSSPDTARLTSCVLGFAVGFICTDFISQFFEEPENPSEKRRRKTHASNPSTDKRQRIVQFRQSVQGDSERALKLKHAISDITSVDSDSELIPAKEALTPLEREIAQLRARASLADSERRRYKEERKWAISQGNMPRASQMKWEVKRYTALMENFNRLADAKVLEAGQLNGTLRVVANDSSNQGIASSSKTKLTFTNNEARQTELRQIALPGAPRQFLRPSTSHRHPSGTLKSAMRDALR
ncbi:hypothetical protein AMATHDRAFT_1042 [Amanita thiersii Skay4041]|uniref:Uncharacterized protein n=1 Tax=Amanita thiersii Skay4041 TaxID=703135 RepID=A0A2A9NS47_9AGAR|nr:hypothetical protein AMATHDRAFT_1042 [Amanita thiersii Skay4041]